MINLKFKLIGTEFFIFLFKMKNSFSRNLFIFSKARQSGTTKYLAIEDVFDW